MSVSPSNDWKIISAYYACYYSLYALLQQVGIKSEIHDCTLALMILFSFTDKEIEFLRKLKDKRINVQYFNKKEHLATEQNIKAFVMRCKEFAQKEDFEKIREKTSIIIKEKK